MLELANASEDVVSGLLTLATDCGERFQLTNLVLKHYHSPLGISQITATAVHMQLGAHLQFLHESGDRNVL